LVSGLYGAESKNRSVVQTIVHARRASVANTIRRVFCLYRVDVVVLFVGNIV